ncbi:hypothetical protein TcasGA2_TC001538 [Tribolium castaneum]|uniref:Uncharacterized protein n=1 Tax=Tribolium castaneum TaxID=7070 RepID=D7EI59_TRICA|nr:hypothetical protein TcasGA2_TC001538 [Tribolium castaneum]
MALRGFKSQTVHYGTYRELLIYWAKCNISTHKNPINRKNGIRKTRTTHAMPESKSQGTHTSLPELIYSIRSHLNVINPNVPPSSSYDLLSEQSTSNSSISIRQFTILPKNKNRSKSERLAREEPNLRVHMVKL